MLAFWSKEIGLTAHKTPMTDVGKFKLGYVQRVSQFPFLSCHLSRFSVFRLF